MYLDKQQMFSEDQSLVLASSSVLTSTNVIDLGVANRGEGEPIEVFANLTTAMTFGGLWTGTGTITIALVTSAAEALSAATTLYTTGAVVAAATFSAAKSLFNYRVLSNDCKRYVGILVTTSANIWITAGNMSAGLVRHVPTNP